MTRRIREQCILAATSDLLIADICQALEHYPVTCVLWLGPILFTPITSLVATANTLQSRGGYQVISAGDHPAKVVDVLKVFGPEVDALYQDGLIDIAECQTVEGIPDPDGKMTWIFSRPNSPDDLIFRERHSLFSSDGFGCNRRDHYSCTCL